MGATINRANTIVGREWGGGDPATYYLGVSIGDIKKDGSGIREPLIGQGGYARIAVPNTKGVDGTFGTADNAKVANVKELAFAIFTADLTVTGATGIQRATNWFLTTDATSTSPELVAYYGKLTKSRPLEGDTICKFGVGDIILEIEMPAV